MNPLFQVTKTEILQRHATSLETFCDKYILNGINSYERQDVMKNKIKAFISSLEPIWENYQKRNFVNIFNEFVNMEFGLETHTYDHSPHGDHVIQEFLFGYNLIMNCSYLSKQYNYNTGNRQRYSDFGELFFSWMASSLFHDLGYDIEKSHEEENYRKKRNNFWSFMTMRTCNKYALDIKKNSKAKYIIESFIIPELKILLDTPGLSYDEALTLFQRDIPGNSNSKRYDHGFISAIKYFGELKKLQNESKNIQYIGWQPSTNAAIAMLLHNFRYKEIELNLSFADPVTRIAYLLMVCDEVQGWERDRRDIDYGDYIMKKTELSGIQFKGNNAYVFINHKPIKPDEKTEFELELMESIASLKRHYPIKLLYSGYYDKYVYGDNRIDFSLSLEFEDDYFMVTEPHQTRDITTTPPYPIEECGDSDNLKKLQDLSSIVNEIKLLCPSSPGPLYEIYVQHMICGKPFLTVIFPF
jgi:hypothetical protein